MLVRVAKRGRKRGLGFCGISQRPANVKKDVITQCDWLCWHRLTWDNDTSVVRRVMDGEAADTVQNLDDGEGIVVTDWDGERRRVQVRRKETFDAGATPGLGGVDRPELKSIGEGLLDDLQDISERQREREDRVARLERKLEQRNERITELETELDKAKDLSDMAEQFTQALAGDNGAASDIDRRESTASERCHQRETLEDDDRTDEGASKANEDESAERANRTNHAERTETEAQGEDASGSYANLLNAEIIHHQIQQAEAHSRASPEYAKGIIATLLDEDGPVKHSAILTRLDISTTEEVSTAATTLESMHIIEKEHTDEGLMVNLSRNGIRTVRAATIQRDRTRELAEEL